MKFSVMILACLCVNIQSFIVINNTAKALILKVTEAADRKPDAKGNLHAPAELNKESKYFTVEPKSFFVIKKFMDCHHIYLDYKRVISIEKTLTSSSEKTSVSRTLYAGRGDNKECVRIQNDWGLLLEEKSSLNQSPIERMMAGAYAVDFVVQLLNPHDDQDLKILVQYQNKK